MDQLGKIKQVRMPVARRIGAVYLAKFALEAGVEDPLLVGSRNIADITVLFLIDETEEIGEGVAELEAESAAVADFKYAVHLEAQPRGVPVLRLDGIIGQSLGRLVGYLLSAFAHHFSP
jgi:hypothetical protein